MLQSISQSIGIKKKNINHGFFGKVSRTQKARKRSSLEVL